MRPQDSARRPAWLDAGLFPYAARFLDLDGGGRVHYVDEGSGPVLLMLHGNPTWSFLYRKLISGLRSRFRCVALDYPGFGLSRSPAGYGFTPREHARVVEQVVTSLDLQHLTPVVHDWGGPIGLAVAARHPERVRALVIANTFAWPVDGDRHFEWFSRLMGGPLGRLAARRLNAGVEVFLRLGVRRSRLPAPVMAHYRRPFRTPASRQPTHVFAAEIRASRDFLGEVERGLGRLAERPALILWGDRDIAFRSTERQRFERLLPRHRTRLLRGAGHYVQEDAPDEMVRAILDWWGDDGPP